MERELYRCVEPDLDEPVVGRKYFTMDREEELQKEIETLEAQLRDREASLPAHSVRPQQMLVIEELETAVEGKRKELDELRKQKQGSSVE
jgi:hypothetical protein